jgi:hypothetical protein
MEPELGLIERRHLRRRLEHGILRSFRQRRQRPIGWFRQG